ncbi:MAG: hypothetical protein ABFD50_04025 [Smithella sp.]
MSNKNQTGHNVAKLASKVLQSFTASNIQKALAGSALAQTHSTKTTSSSVEKIAAKALQSGHYSKTTKSLAGSIVSQSDKKR